VLRREDYERFRVSPIDPATLRIADVERCLKLLVESSGERIEVNRFSESFAGSPILLAMLGSGPRRVLLWSQMHGDESTHTAVLLDLLSYLTRRPAEPLAADIVANCTLQLFPMLNPDGAELSSRFNAQGIDVNRDALRLATPEGRALRKAVDTFRPQYAFNLHNQNARTAVGDPPKPAAVSLLAPPVDATGRETPSMRLAKRMAACFVEAVRPHADGMISRYDDEYEPRAFGDTIQASGAATMLVEAGGWPGKDPEPLVRLHFHGLLATLHAIATGAVQTADPQIYESLPQSNSHKLFDCLVAGGHVLVASTAQPFQVDLGIDHSHGQRLAMTNKRDGKISDLGDLTTTAGKINIDATDCLILPGRVAVFEGWKPGTTLSEHELNKAFSRGITTMIGCVDLADGEALKAMSSDYNLPVNLGFVASLESARSLPTADRLELIARAAAGGVLGVIGDHADEATWEYLHHFRLPLLQPKQLQSLNGNVDTYQELAKQTSSACQLLGLDTHRGHVARGKIADLLVFQLGTGLYPMQPLDWHRLTRVVVAGETVWDSHRLTGATPGVLLTRP
jgi:hypothetical protein